MACSTRHAAGVVTDAVVIEGSTLEPEAHLCLFELEATVVAPARALSAHVVLDLRHFNESSGL
eukprot:3931828-Rhodomonas_salina.2